MTVTRGLILDSVFYQVSGLEILKGVYLRADPGAITGIFGRNGSGKSTVLKIAAGQISPTSGQVVIDGERFHRPLRRKRYAHIAYLPQVSMLPGNIRVMTLMKAFPRGRDLMRDDALLRRVRALFIANLSYGERRYLELRLVLSLARRYVILDEPFTGIEPQIIERMSRAISEASDQGQTVIVTDHYYKELLPIIDDIYMIADGRCYRLQPGRDFQTQLQEHGYLPQF